MPTHGFLNALCAIFQSSLFLMFKYRCADDALLLLTNVEIYLRQAYILFPCISLKYPQYRKITSLKFMVIKMF
jgi:hypothetical protein